MKLAIGTAQFGLDYGVSNSSGRTPFTQVQSILHRAGSAGIDTLDTAAAYGDSEQVLGRIGVQNWCIISKVPSLPEASVNGRNWVLDNVQQSLARLQVKRIDGLLLHSATDILKPQGADIIAGLMEAKADGRVGKVGYSIYSPDLLPDLLARLVPDLIQAPLNIFDQRLINSGWLTRLVDSGIEIHTRSAFLQGLLLMSNERRPKYFARWDERWQHWATYVEEHGGSALAACLSFVKAQPGVSRVVVGVENPPHLEELLIAWEQAHIPTTNAFACNDRHLIEPINWVLK
jgi:aryl-alcohol dehydrogenase-like predicted oxidoreductase